MRNDGEWHAMMRYVYDVRFGLTTADVYAGKADGLSADDKVELGRIVSRLEQGEPVQYAIGKAEFGGRLFDVEPGVLIPRPETAELCAWITDDCRQTPRPKLRCLDIGTGSGCIAVTLAAELEQAVVEACDISVKALDIARRNARKAGVDIEFYSKDILAGEISRTGYDLIVSNPPYVCYNERELMERNVLDYEPPEALFVPDSDPLLFYRAITRFAAKTLNSHGKLYFEINPLYASQLTVMLRRHGFDNVEIRCDSYDRERFCRAEFI